MYRNTNYVDPLLSWLWVQEESHTNLLGAVLSRGRSNAQRLKQ
jgi:hypothetical protein